MNLRILKVSETITERIHDKISIERIATAMGDRPTTERNARKAASITEGDHDRHAAIHVGDHPFTEACIAAAEAEAHPTARGHHAGRVAATAATVTAERNAPIRRKLSIKFM